jgi:MFS family permease
MVLIVARKIVPAIIRDRGPRAATIAGSLLFAAGYALWALSWRSEPMYVSAALPGLILTGLGVGLVMPATIVAGTAALPAGRFATGSAVLSMSRQVGAVAGTAGLVALIGSNPSSSDLRTSAAVLSIASLAVLVPSYWLVLPSEKGNSNAGDR